MQDFLACISLKGAFSRSSPCRLPHSGGFVAGPLHIIHSDKAEDHDDEGNDTDQSEML